jgi:hypothetical protein
VDFQKAEAANAAVDMAEAAASVARALAVLDALDEHRDSLTSHDRYDRAFAAWQTMTDIDVPLTDEQVTAVAARVWVHLPEEAMVDLVDAHFGEHEKRIRLADGSGLVWLPDAETLILSGVLPGLGFVDAVLTRMATPRRA